MAVTTGIPKLDDLRRRYARARSIVDACKSLGFTLEGLIDGRSKDVDAAEDLLAFLRHVEGGTADGLSTTRRRKNERDKRG